VRQLITRIDEELLLKLKERAAAEGRSVNSLVKDILASELAVRSARTELLRRGSDRLFKPPRPTRIPSRPALRLASREWGTSVSHALMRERAEG
jgi:plasmid stability protein